jgi:hypothetical protein
VKTGYSYYQEFILTNLGEAQKEFLSDQALLWSKRHKLFYENAKANVEMFGEESFLSRNQADFLTTLPGFERLEGMHHKYDWNLPALVHTQVKESIETGHDPLYFGLCPSADVLISYQNRPTMEDRRNNLPREGVIHDSALGNLEYFTNTEGGKHPLHRVFMVSPLNTYVRMFGLHIPTDENLALGFGKPMGMRFDHWLASLGKPQFKFTKAFRKYSRQVRADWTRERRL